MPDPFAVKDCAVLALSTGRRASTLSELAIHLKEVHPGSIFYHFWGGRLRPRAENRLYQNDFAAWASSVLNDRTLAERLGAVDPTAFHKLEALRNEVADIIEERLNDVDYLPNNPVVEPFVFIRSQLVIFDTTVRLKSVSDFRKAVPKMNLGSIFYHFIDARRRTEGGLDDFRAWLAGKTTGGDALMERLAGIDPYFCTLPELRDRLTAAFAA